MAERQAKRRAKLRNNNDDYSAYLEKDKLRKREQRAAKRNSMSDKELEEYKLKEMMRVRKYRAGKNASQPSTSAGSTSTTPYRTTQARGKAIKRAQASLPASPHKRQCVVESLAKGAGLTIVSSSPVRSTLNAISEQTKQLVITFFISNEISWQAPGRKDCITIWEKDSAGNRVKRVEQTRYMLMSLKEAYATFREKNPDAKIGLTKFCAFRPANVKVFDHLPHHVCVCQYHENIRLLLEALKSHTSLKSDFHGFIDQVTCNPSNKACMSSNCDECKLLIDDFTPMSPETPIAYLQWQKNERVQKVNIVATAIDAFTELKKQLKHFLIHTYVKRKQMAKMDELIEACNFENIVVQVDFSENASIVSQREVQSAHWSHGQATLFTGHGWIAAKKSESFVIISDDLTHAKYSIYVFMDYIFKNLLEKYPQIKKINVFSDGPSSQFKQRFLFSNLYTWEEKHKVNVIWNFFATSHGKGVVDGLGGTVKRSVWRHVRSEQAHITNPQEYAVVAKERNPNITIHFISKDVIEAQNETLDAHWEGVLAVPQTQQKHCFKPLGKSKLMVADTSDSMNFSIVSIRPHEDEPSVEDEPSAEDEPFIENEPSIDQVAMPTMSFSVGMWVIITYDGENFPGEITAISDDIEVSVMHRSGTNWKWPSPVDKISYDKADIVKIISSPTVVGSRGQFTFADSI